MKADTRLFGRIDIEDEKIITLEGGMIGFPDLKKFTLIFDEEKEKKAASIMWFQSMDEPSVAFPVMHPNELKPDYNPTVTVSAAPDVKKTSVNLKAPIVINTETKKGCQIIVEDDYPVKFNVYEALQSRKKAEE